jgi:hypothetical protein
LGQVLEERSSEKQCQRISLIPETLLQPDRLQGASALRISF